MAKQIDPPSMSAVTVSIIIADVLVASGMTMSTRNAREQRPKKPSKG